MQQIESELAQMNGFNSCMSYNDGLLNVVFNDESGNFDEEIYCDLKAIVI